MSNDNEEVEILEKGASHKTNFGLGGRRFLTALTYFSGSLSI
jgi:hypothetical protein